MLASAQHREHAVGTEWRPVNYRDAGPPPPRLSVMGGLGGVAGREAGCRPRQQDTSWVPPVSDEGAPQHPGLAKQKSI